LKKIYTVEIKEKGPKEQKT